MSNHDGSPYELLDLLKGKIPDANEDLDRIREFVVGMEQQMQCRRDEMRDLKALLYDLNIGKEVAASKETTQDSASVHQATAADLGSPPSRREPQNLESDKTKEPLSEVSPGLLDISVEIPVRPSRAPKGPSVGTLLQSVKPQASTAGPSKPVAVHNCKERVHKAITIWKKRNRSKASQASAASTDPQKGGSIQRCPGCLDLAWRVCQGANPQ